MKQRASPGALVVGRGPETETTLRPRAAGVGNQSACIRVGRFAVGGVAVVLVVLLATVLVSSPAAATPSAGIAGVTHHVMLPLVMGNAPALNGSMGTSPPYDIVVRVEDAGGNPIEGARIVGLYTDSEGRTTSIAQVTDASGEVIFPGSDHEIIFEVQFPAGILPCPESPPRIRVNPGQTAVKFVGCRL